MDHMAGHSCDPWDALPRFAPAPISGAESRVSACARGRARCRAVAGAVDIRPEHRQSLLQGIGVLYDCAAGSLNQAATNFERLALATILRVPPELYLEQVRRVCSVFAAPACCNRERPCRRLALSQASSHI